MLKSNQKGFGIFEVLIIFIVIALISSAGWYFFNQSKNSHNTNPPLNDKASSEINVKLEYFSSVEYVDSGGIDVGPCRTNSHGEGENVTFVITEQFPSLDNFEDAKVLKTYKTDVGKVELSIEPGRYGLYMIDDDTGNKKLYDNLELGNYTNTVPINTQGPWYVDVSSSSNEFVFRELNPC